jgi:hypothetical protein
VKVSGRRQDRAPLVSNGALVSEMPDGEELLGDSGEPDCIAKVKDWEAGLMHSRKASCLRLS